VGDAIVQVKTLHEVQAVVMEALTGLAVPGYLVVLLSVLLSTMP